MRCGDVTERGPQVVDAVGREAVVEPVLVTAGHDEAGAGQRAEVERGVGHALVDIVGEFLLVAFALGEYVALCPPSSVTCQRGCSSVQSMPRNTTPSSVTDRSPTTASAVGQGDLSA
jgi:hypothetical protein